MERRRLDFASELESQRVQFFLNTQMELSQVKNLSSSPANAVAPPGATTTGGTSRRMASVNDAGASGNYHRRYRVSESGRHRHPPPRPHYQYHENNVAAAAATAAASDGEQSDEEDEDEEEEIQ
uniref:Uncharacterized protein n=2 Tax=Oryza brachyantha TaxID=4533 RepID=J3LY94_ORYBR